MLVEPEQVGALAVAALAALLRLQARLQAPLLLVEQSSERALNAADRLYVLRNGEIQLEGKTADLQDGKAVHKAYFGFTHEHDEDEVEF